MENQILILTIVFPRTIHTPLIPIKTPLSSTSLTTALAIIMLLPFPLRQRLRYRHHCRLVNSRRLTHVSRWWTAWVRTLRQLLPPRNLPEGILSLRPEAAAQLSPRCIQPTLLPLVLLHPGSIPVPHTMMMMMMMRAMDLNEAIGSAYILNAEDESKLSEWSELFILKKILKGKKLGLSASPTYYRCQFWTCIHLPGFLKAEKDLGFVTSLSWFCATQF